MIVIEEGNFFFLQLCYWKPQLVDFNTIVLKLQSGY